MATYTQVQAGYAENMAAFAAAASTPSNFTSSDTVNTGAFMLAVDAPYSMARINVASGGTLALGPNASFSNTVISAPGTIIQSAGFMATTSQGSPITGPASGGSSPPVFVSVRNG